jgi:uncharacterized protein (DUF427 family)
MSLIAREPIAEGQESVWDYPRPPIAERTSRHIRIIHQGVTLADTTAAVRTLETSHPPTYYIPQADITMSLLTATDRTSFCEWKGHAVYWTVAIAGSIFTDIGWSYPAPTTAYSILRDHIAFYAAPFDACLVDDVAAVPQPGGFYGGWITPDVVGPFKGIPGSHFW